MASSWGTTPSASTTRRAVESAQTIQSRGLREGTDMYVLDEGHEVRPELIRQIADSGAILVGTDRDAFPGRPRRASGLTPAGGRTQGRDAAIGTRRWSPPRRRTNSSPTCHLCPFDVVAPEAVVDTEGVEIQGGEFRKATLKERIMRIVGDIVPTWRAQLDERYGGEVQPTIVFGATVDDAEAIQREFRQAGYPARLVSSRENDDDNKRIIECVSRRGVRRAGQLRDAEPRRRFPALDGPH